MDRSTKAIEFVTELARLKELTMKTEIEKIGPVPDLDPAVRDVTMARARQIARQAPAPRGSPSLG